MAGRAAGCRLVLRRRPGQLRGLAGYWRAGYDWREHEARLNEIPQFTTEIDGQNVHFLHVRSPEPDATPLILTHGWPSTPADFLAILGPLADPRSHGGDPSDAFHVVAPSVPGFGFSGPTRDAGWDVPRIARAWAELMRRLRYERYGAAGGDYGSLTNVTTYWLTGTAGSAARIYRETGASWGSRPEPSGVPTAVANFQGDHAVRGLAELANTVVRWTEYPVGGHFASLQAPAELVTDIREFFHSIAR